MRPVEFSTRASNQAGVTGSKNETIETGFPLTSPSPRTRALATAAQNGNRLSDRRQLGRLHPLRGRCRPVPPLRPDDDRRGAARDRVGELIGRNGAVHRVESVGRARCEPLVPDERLERPPDLRRPRHGGGTAPQVEGRRELDRVPTGPEAHLHLAAKEPRRNVPLVAARAARLERSAGRRHREPGLLRFPGRSRPRRG